MAVRIAHDYAKRGDVANGIVANSTSEATVLPARRVLIIGGGYIGLEAAAVARHRGLDVTVMRSFE